ncbi:hypothetical protein PHMEG_00029273 [Phytophthora megakarya]|uniref:Uncharacterized protein n=1 Tax=Phytophthora megakarya TaxID=4795 RepID=A0A225V427_9STRA|nr:hypothetical protein PHMEG_00029273 [Phytophthora megakarya]
MLAKAAYCRQRTSRTSRGLPHSALPAGELPAVTNSEALPSHAITALFNTDRLSSQLGKREQNKFAEAYTAVNVMLVLYQKAFEIPIKDHGNSVPDLEALVVELALKMDTTANERLHTFDHK